MLDRSTNGWRDDVDLPFYGSIQDRAITTDMANKKLEEMCGDREFIFLNVNKYFRDDFGFLMRPLSNGIVHIRKEFCGIMSYELEERISMHLRKAI